MTHLPYLIAAFAVFLLFLACDALGAWLRLRHARQQALRRQQRLQARSNGTAPSPLATELSR